MDYCFDILILLLLIALLYQQWEIKATLKQGSGEIPDEAGERIDAITEDVKKIVP